MNASRARALRDVARVSVEMRTCLPVNIIFVDIQYA